MRKVKNKKVIRRLADRSFRASRTRNLMAVHGHRPDRHVVYHACLRWASARWRTFSGQTMRQSGSDCHGVIKNLTKEQYDKLSKDPSIVESADCMLVADRVENEAFLKRHLESLVLPAVSLSALFYRHH